MHYIRCPRGPRPRRIGAIVSNLSPVQYVGFGVGGSFDNHCAKIPSSPTTAPHYVSFRYQNDLCATPVSHPVKTLAKWSESRRRVTDFRWILPANLGESILSMRVCNHNNSHTLSFSYLPHFEQVDIHENEFEYPSQDQPRHETILFR